MNHMHQQQRKPLFFGGGEACILGAPRAAISTLIPLLATGCAEMPPGVPEAAGGRDGAEVGVVFERCTFGAALMVRPRAPLKNHSSTKTPALRWTCDTRAPPRETLPISPSETDEMTFLSDRTVDRSLSKGSI